VLAFRAILSVGLIVLGAIIIGRVFQAGYQLHSVVSLLPGVVLGVAMIALGIVRLSMIRRMRSLP
jgi:hypothetical membrane protein